MHALESRIERVQVESRVLDVLRERRVRPLQRSEPLLMSLRRRCASRCADDRADGTDKDSDEKAGLESGKPPHERVTVP